MRSSRALAFPLLAVLPLSACDRRQEPSGPDPAALLQPLVGLHRLVAVGGVAIPAELEPSGDGCEEREPFRNPAGPRLGGHVRTMFFDGSLQIGPLDASAYALSLSVRTRCTFADGGHQELEDQWQEEGGLVLDDAAVPSFRLRSPLRALDGYTHLETMEPVLQGEDGDALRLAVRVNGAPMTLTFRRTL